MAAPIRQSAGDPPLRVEHAAPTSWLRSHAPNLTLAALRIVAGLMFTQHGVQKLFGLLPMPGMGPMPSPTLFSQMWLAGVLELVGGILIALGLFTRLSGFILAGEMAVAYFQVHLPRGLFPVLNGGELAALYSFVFLALAGLGPGAYSLDHLIAIRRSKTEYRAAIG